MKMHLLAGVAAALIAAIPGAAHPFAEGVAAYQKGEHAVAYELWQPLAEEGDVLAQFNLGIMYGRGIGVPQDHAAARAWLRLAAEQGDASAAYGLALTYADGLGIAQDYAEAAHWYEVAAKRGHPGAMVDLAILYANGRGVPQDSARAVYWHDLGVDTECSLGESDMIHGLRPRIALERRQVVSQF